MNTTLETLTKDLPASVRLQIREALDHTNIKNPNDPIFELMMVLGIWAKYFQSIPNCVEKASTDAGRSFDSRLTQFQLLAQQIQSVIDKLEATPKALETLFPSETVARNIAGKVDDHFRALPLLQLEADVERVEQSLNRLLGKDGKPGLAVKVDSSVERLEQTVKLVKKLDPTRTPWWQYAICFLAGAIVTSLFMWLDIGLSVKQMSAELKNSSAGLRLLNDRVVAAQQQVETFSQQISAMSEADTHKLIHLLRVKESVVVAIDESNIRTIESKKGVKYIHVGTPHRK